MAYVNRDGRVVEGGKMSWRRPVDSFKHVLGIFVLFVLSLFGPILQLFGPTAGSGSSSGFRGGSSGSGNSGPSDRGNRRGGFRTMSDIKPPPMPFGGCSGGSCG